MTLSDEHTDLVVVHLEEESCDAGHSTLTVHGQSEVVAMVAILVAGLLASEADEIGHLPGEELGEDDEDLAASA